MNIGIWYVYYDNPDPDWKSPVAQAFNIALPRLGNYFGTNWTYQFIKEFHTSVKYDYAIMPNKCIKAMADLANTDPNFKTDYAKCELPFFVFANATEAFIFDYKSPVWASGESFLHQMNGLVIIEHEIGHTFGLPDHMKPFDKPYYQDCMMGNLYLKGIQLCPECKPKFILSNYQKHTFEAVIGGRSTEIPDVPNNVPVYPPVEHISWLERYKWPIIIGGIGVGIVTLALRRKL